MFVEMFPTYETEISTGFLCNFEKDAVLSVMKFACEPASKNTRKVLDSPWAFILSPQLRWLVSLRKKLE